MCCLHWRRGKGDKEVWQLQNRQSPIVLTRRQTIAESILATQNSAHPDSRRISLQTASQQPAALVVRHGEWPTCTLCCCRLCRSLDETPTSNDAQVKQYPPSWLHGTTPEPAQHRWYWGQDWPLNEMIFQRRKVGTGSCQDGSSAPSPVYSPPDSALDTIFQILWIYTLYSKIRRVKLPPQLLHRR